jgi:hypothetical protein
LLSTRNRTVDTRETAIEVRSDPLRSRSLSIGICAAALVAAFAPAAQADTTVCNEAENSPRGGYVVTDGPVDPAPPAFLRGSTMNVGDGAGVVNAAEHSPALRVCGPEGEDDGGDDDGGGPSNS